MDSLSALRGWIAVALLATGCATTGPSPIAKIPRAECGRGPGFEFCLHLPAAADRRAPPVVLYFLHGGGGDPSSWRTWPVAREFYKSFREQGLPVPAVAVVSFGRLWLLTEGGPGPSDGLLERFVGEVVPMIEGKTGRPDRRLVWGMSMGGFNAAQLVLKHPSLWDSAVLSCPAITTLGYAPDAAVVSGYISRTGADRGKVQWMVEALRSWFPSEESWTGHDPLRLAASASSLPPILVECGDRDEFGFFEGASRFAQTLEARGKTVKFHRVEGGRHCAVDLRVVLPFLRDSAAGGSVGSGG